MKKVIFLFVILILFKRCTKPNIACFTCSPSTTIVAGDSITFDAECSSKNSSTFRWNFGDGSKDTTTIIKTINHKFTTSGSYVVKLMANRKDGIAFRKGRPETSLSITVH